MRLTPRPHQEEEGGGRSESDLRKIFWSLAVDVYLHEVGGRGAVENLARVPSRSGGKRLGSPSSCVLTKWGEHTRGGTAVILALVVWAALARLRLQRGVSHVSGVPRSCLAVSGTRLRWFAFKSSMDASAPPHHYSYFIYMRYSYIYPYDIRNSKS